MSRKFSKVDYTNIESFLSLQRENNSSISTSQQLQKDNQAPSPDSFRYKPLGTALQSTQQLPVDWSDFSKHTFFSSAVANTNVAFDLAINNFPFDGTFIEIEDFFDSLTGFESYVFNSFPTSLNSLTFKNNSYIEVVDAAGSKFPELSRNVSGASVLDPGTSTISFQFKLFVPDEPNDNQVIAQRLVSNSGYTLAVSQSSSTDSADFLFSYTSGSSALTTQTSVQKGAWNDIAAVFNRRPGINKLQIYVDGNLVSSSSVLNEINVFTSLSSNLYIGTGSLHENDQFEFLPVHTLSASLDDFKIFIGNRTAEEIKYASSNPVEPSKSLRLFFKFNEPSGSYDRNLLVIDSSGNGLHSTITNFNSSLRDSTAETNGLAQFKERPIYNPVLFPDYDGIKQLNASLLSSANLYDLNNPNIILKLIPPHYLEEEQSNLGFDSVNGEIGRNFSDGGNLPRSTPLGSVQLITSMLLIWAKQFDEMKMYIDQMSKLNLLSYDENSGIADTFLPNLAKSYGLDLPRIFTSQTYKQYLHGDNLTEDFSIGFDALKQLEANIWRRILVDMPNIIKSKGTMNSVKSIIRSVGIDPDVTLRFKEYGGANKGYITSRKKRKKSINFTTTGSFLITSPYLSGTRTEPGIPEITNTSSDGLFTTSSFSFEAHYKFPKNENMLSISDSSSAFRLLSTGTFDGSYEKALLLNVIVEQSGTLNSPSANITLSGSYSNDTSNAQRFSILIEDVPVFDDEPFYLSVSRNRKSEDTSDWYLRFGKNVGNNIILTESLKTITVDQDKDNFSNISQYYNASGSFFEIGTSDIDDSVDLYLNDPLLNSTSNLGKFNGSVSQVRFWSKFLSGSEWEEHVKNPESIGVLHPSKNFNFTTFESGSFERIRIDAGLAQPITSSNIAGSIDFIDFAQNELHLSGTGFASNSRVIFPFEMHYNPINPYFDESSNDEKVRVRSWLNEKNSQIYGGSSSPIYRIDESEISFDDNRFGIEISVVRALNEDITVMFGGHEAIDEIYGNPADMFSDEYSNQNFVRSVYFNRLTDPISFKNVIIFSKWFESNIENLIKQVIPFNTEFLGTNLVIESHLLERNKFRYNWYNVYLKD